MNRLRDWLEIRLFCNWFAIALRCRRNGHDYQAQFMCPCTRAIVCTYCGNYRGARVVREKCYRTDWSVKR